MRLLRVLHLHLDSRVLLTTFRGDLDLFSQVLPGVRAWLSKDFWVTRPIVIITVFLVLRLEQFCKLGEFVFCLLSFLSLG